MATQEAKSIYQRMANIMNDVGAIGKNEVNKHQKWKFRGIDTIYQECQKVFMKHGVIPGHEVMSFTQKGVTSSLGKPGFYMTAHIRVHFKSDGGNMFCDTIATSTDFGDKVGGQVMSMAAKKAIIDVLMIPVNDYDPDSEAKEMSETKSNGVPVRPIKYTPISEKLFTEKLNSMTANWDEKYKHDDDGYKVTIKGIHLLLSPNQFDQMDELKNIEKEFKGKKS